MTAKTRPLFRPLARRATVIAATLLLGLTPLTPTLTPAMAQSFRPVIRVNDKVITQYEIDQRVRLLQVLSAPGDLVKTAHDQLIEERLKAGAAAQYGIKPDEAAIQNGMKEFAGRANMEPQAFIDALAAQGVSEQTFRDFIIAGVTWRVLVRGRYGSKVQISETDIDRAIASQTKPGGVRVLLSEIFIPLDPSPPEAEALANRLSQISSTADFAAAARQYSAAPTGPDGGAVDWMDISTLPPALQPVIMGLAPGEVTAPLPVQGALALFQMRSKQEIAAPRTTYSAVEYASYYIAGGRTPEALAQASKIARDIDTCDDLYGVAKGQPASVLERETKAPGEIPQDIALELAKLDDNEISTALTRNNGQTLMLLMLCGRTPEGAPAEVDRAQVSTQLQNRRLASYADGYLAQLRADARIVE